MGIQTGHSARLWAIVFVCGTYVGRSSLSATMQSTTNIYYYDPTVRSMLFRAEITIKLKNGMLDPEAATIKNALKHLGYECRSVKQAAIFELEFEADTRQNATDVAEGMCQRLLANPIIHDYNIELV